MHEPDRLSIATEIVFQFLDALRKSRELEEKYLPLSPSIKAATSKSLRRLSEEVSKSILNSGKPLEIIEEQDILEAISGAIGGNVKSNGT